MTMSLGLSCFSHLPLVTRTVSRRVFSMHGIYFVDTRVSLQSRHSRDMRYGPRQQHRGERYQTQLSLMGT